MTDLARRTALSLPVAAAASIPEQRETWRDAARARDVPVLLRLPEAGGPAPAVVVSHGLGGSREGLAYLGRALAKAGFIALHVQHAGSDRAIWENQANPAEGMQRAVRDPRVAMARLQDIPFALDELLRRHPDQVDTARLAIAGHSFGAWTAQHALGQALPLPVAGIPERRLRAGVLLSPVPGQGTPRLEALRAPLLHVTGSEDWTMVDRAGPEERLAVYRSAKGVPQAAAVFRGASHLAFAGTEEVGASRAGTAFHDRTAELAVLFLQATLLGDGSAMRRIGDGVPNLLRLGDTLTTKDWAL